MELPLHDLNFMVEKSKRTEEKEKSTLSPENLRVEKDTSTSLT